MSLELIWAELREKVRKVECLSRFDFNLEYQAFLWRGQGMRWDVPTASERANTRASFDLF